MLTVVLGSDDDLRAAVAAAAARRGLTEVIRLLGGSDEPRERPFGSRA